MSATQRLYVLWQAKGALGEAALSLADASMLTSQLQCEDLLGSLHALDKALGQFSGQCSCNRLGDVDATTAEEAALVSRMRDHLQGWEAATTLVDKLMAPTMLARHKLQLLTGLKSTRDGLSARWPELSSNLWLGMTVPDATAEGSPDDGMKVRSFPMRMPHAFRRGWCCP